MNKVTTSTIQTLAKQQTGEVLSLYMPTHRYPSPPHIQEDQSRFKNMLHQARRLIEAHPRDNRALAGHLDGLEAMLDDLPFWQSMLEGLAVFVGPDGAQMYQLPIECEESVDVAARYNIAPLLVLESYNQPFYILALALQDSRVYRGDSYDLKAVDIDLPRSVEAALNIDEMFSNSRTKRSHQGGPTGARDVTAPHGEGDSNGAGSQERLQYFRMIDDKLMNDTAVDTRLPILLAATDNEAGDYRAMTRLPSLMHEFLKGNWTVAPLQELHRRAWPMVLGEIVHRKDRQLVEHFHELRGVDKASTKLKDIERAAADGRIDTLLVNLLDETRDTIRDAASGTVPVIRAVSAAGRTKLRRLIDLVYHHGGTMIGLEPSMMPEGAVAAALYRY